MKQHKDIIDLIWDKNKDKIDDNEYHDCKFIRSFSIPETIKQIGENAFSNSTIAQILLSDTITQIGKSAFENCINLRKITIPNSIEIIPKCSFKGCNFKTK